MTYTAEFTRPQFEISGYTLKGRDTSYALCDVSTRLDTTLTPLASYAGSISQIYVMAG